MRFIHGSAGDRDLTYSEVFLVPSYSEVSSRMDVDISPPDNTGATIPVVVANMNAVSGRRMAETVARRGGLAVFPQDVDLDAIADMTASVKGAHPVLDTAITLTGNDNINNALALINKRAHGAVIVVDNDRRPIGIFTEGDQEGADPFTQLSEVMTQDPITVKDSLDARLMFEQLAERRVHLAPVVDDSGVLVGIITRRGAVRSTLYRPATDGEGRLLVAAAVGISPGAGGRARSLIEAGVDLVVVDTAHGHQGRMLEALREVRSSVDDRPLVAGNVVTTQAVSDLIDAGADIVKVGVGPGAMCTTRMMTGVGRPQFSAVVECAAEARSRGRNVWADGGVRYPRDVALALAAGASAVMVGTWFAGTYESAAPAMRDMQGNIYKENYGMASRLAVTRRTAGGSGYDRALKVMFEEGISEGRIYITADTPSVEDMIDKITFGLRSSLTYSGASTISEFYERAVVGVQSSAGYSEGQPLHDGW